MFIKRFTKHPKNRNAIANILMKILFARHATTLIL